MFTDVANRLSILFLSSISLLGGIVKITQYQPELDLYLAVGFSPFGLILFGCLQLAGGLLLCVTKTRSAGVILATLSFTVSMGLAIIHGMLDIAVALLPVVLIGCYVWKSAPPGDATPNVES
jgi:hypothetical protein